MPLDLAQPLTWPNATPAQIAALANLQGNILKGHGREHTVNTFMRFSAADATAVRAFLRGISVSNAHAQLVDSAAVRAARKANKKAAQTPPFVALFLSATAYQKLGIAPSLTPSDPKFRAGLKASQVPLLDPPVAKWQEAFRGEIDILLLVGEGNASKARAATNAILAHRPPAMTVLAQEIGVAYRNENKDGIEHFGYVDGRSQPLLITEDIERERDLSTGTDQWDPAFPLKTALVPEPGGTADAFGSYFVFRKLEQNVKGFKSMEQKLAKHLGLKGPEQELAGALVVGRFEDGTPIALQHAEGMHHPVPNNFGFGADPTGRKCPLQAHIRKSNPRGDSVRLGATLASEREHLMARRGITYGKRKVAKGGGFVESDKPTKDVGLLFMAYNADIARQFEFTQASWVNNANFVDPNTGIDPVIGHANGPVAAQSWPVAWGSKQRKNFAFGGFVTMRGGEYFFAPSLSFLKGL
jgi:Dyp-type peroxidase family